MELHPESRSSLFMNEYFARGNCGFEESFCLSSRLYFCICYHWLITSSGSTRKFPFHSVWIKMAHPCRDGLYFSPPGGAWFIYLRAVYRGRDRNRNRNREKVGWEMKNARETWKVEGNCYRLSNSWSFEQPLIIDARAWTVERSVGKEGQARGLVVPIPIAQVIWKRGERGGERGRRIARFCGSFDVIFPRGINLTVNRKEGREPRNLFELS